MSGVGGQPGQCNNIHNLSHLFKMKKNLGSIMKFEFVSTIIISDKIYLMIKKQWSFGNILGTDFATKENKII